MGATSSPDQSLGEHDPPPPCGEWRTSGRRTMKERVATRTKVQKDSAKSFDNFIWMDLNSFQHFLSFVPLEYFCCRNLSLFCSLIWFRKLPMFSFGSGGGSSFSSFLGSVFVPCSLLSVPSLKRENENNCIFQCSKNLCRRKQMRAISGRNSTQWQTNDSSWFCWFSCVRCRKGSTVPGT